MTITQRLLNELNNTLNPFLEKCTYYSKDNLKEAKISSKITSLQEALNKWQSSKDIDSLLEAIHTFTTQLDTRENPFNLFSYAIKFKLHQILSQPFYDTTLSDDTVYKTTLSYLNAETTNMESFTDLMENWKKLESFINNQPSETDPLLGERKENSACCKCCLIL